MTEKGNAQDAQKEEKKKKKPMCGWDKGEPTNNNGRERAVGSGCRQEVKGKTC